MEYNEKLYLLRELKSDDYDNLIAQLELEKMGYTTYFVLDANIFHNYCFPLGIVPNETRAERRMKLNADFLSDEQITLHTIFYLNETHKKILLLDEYLFEIEGMLYKAKKVGAENIKRLNPDFPILDLNYIRNDKSEIKELFYTYFSQIYATVLLNINGLKKAYKILNEGRILLDSDEIGVSAIKNIIDENRGDENNIEKIEELMFFILNQDKRTKKKSLYGSRKRDAIIIDRLLSFNNNIIDSNYNEKAIFVLLSDSSLMSDAINYLRNEYSSIKYPLFLNKKILLCRNIPQTFAYLVSVAYRDDKSIDLEKTIANIKVLRESSRSLNQQFDNTSDELNVDTNDLLKFEIFVRYNNLRNAFENAGLLKSFDKLYRSIKDELKNKTLTDVKSLFEKYEKDSSAFLSDIITDQIRFLESLRKAGEFNSVFVSGINKIKQGMPLDISKGSDYIEGSHHHLPILLTFSSSNSKYLETLCELVKIVLSHKSTGNSILLEQLKKVIKEMNSSNIFDKDDTDINLIKTLIFMILPSKLSESNQKENDLLAQKWISNLKINEKKESIANLLYLKVWCERRISNYKESIKIALDAIKKYPEDPRFFHGSFLSEFCLYEEDKSNNSKILLSLIESMLRNLMHAKTLYPKFILNHYQDQFIASIMLDAMNDSFFNSYSYCLALKASVLKKYGDVIGEDYSNLIQEAQEYFARLEDESEILKDRFPEYYDTGAFILYHSSFCDKIENHEEILQKALKYITEAQMLTKDISLINKYQSREEMIKARLNELNLTSFNK